MLNTLQNCTKPVKLKTGLIVPCGTCILCNIKKAIEWNMRVSHEMLGKNAIFITLTYKSRYLPKEGYLGREIVRNSPTDTGGNLRPNDFTKFIKRLRVWVERKTNIKEKLKYIMCGEYGSEEKTNRPHYHAVIIGLSPRDLDDKTLSELWGMGRVDLSDVNATEHSVEYVTGYVRKKRLDKANKIKDYYSKGRLPPYQRVSKGIGKEWAIKNVDNWCDSLKLSYKSLEVSVPRYYIRVIKKLEGVTYKVDKIVYFDEAGKEKEYYKIVNVGENRFKAVKEWETLLPKTKFEVNRERRYITFEDVLYGNYTKRINEALFKRKYENLEKIKNDVSLLKRDDYFDIVKAEEEEIEIHWGFYHKKCADYVHYFYDYVKFLKDYREHRTTDKEIKNSRFKSQGVKKWIPPKIWCFDEMHQIAKFKEKAIINGSFGKRDKIDFFE